MGCIQLYSQVNRKKVQKIQSKQSVQISGQQMRNQQMKTSPFKTQQLQQMQQAEETITKQKNSLREDYNLTKRQIQKRYASSSENKDNDKDQKQLYENLSKDMTNYYMRLSQISLQELIQHRKTDTEAKVRISQQILLLSLDVFEIVGRRNNFTYTSKNFQMFNQVQGNLMSFLKAKYPRAGNIFVPGELNQKFKNFNMIDNYQNQMLRNSHTHFGLLTKKSQVVNTLKSYFNKLFKQLDDSFPKFQKILQQKIFRYEQDGKLQILPYKINRKIPQNVARFKQDDSQQMLITSPELFRTIIKWNQYLQQIISSSEENLKTKQTFNIYQNRKNKYEDQIVNRQEVDDIIPQLIRRFTEANESYKKSMKQFQQQIGNFDANLLKILFTTQRKQKFIPKQEANVIKYAYFNTQVISWVAKEILVFLITKLVEAGRSIRSHGKLINVNLITFLVSDLMRGMVTGSKKQIIAVFQNIMQLEKIGQIKIIKIKNRLGTLLNDAMVIFKIKGSYIICQLQLVLSENSTNATQKLKYVQTMHHFFYQLERSPYGVLSEIAVLLGFKDTKIAYCQNIGFDQNNLFKLCGKNHTAQIQKQRTQPNPIICMTCSQFYNPYQNMFQFRRCKTCNIYQCCFCTLKNDTGTRLKQISSKFLEKFADSIKYQGNRQLLIKMIFFQQKLQFCQLKGLGVSSKGKSIHNYLKQKQYLKNFKKADSIKKQKQIYFLIVNFKGNFVKFKQFYWNKQLQQFQNCFDAKQVLSDMNKVTSSDFDFIYLFQTQKIMIVNSKTKSRFIMHSISKFENLDIQKYHIIEINPEKAYLLRYQQNNDADLTNMKIPNEILAKKKSFGHDSIQQVYKNKPKISFVEENFSLVNSGVTSKLLSDYFQNNKVDLLRNDKIKQVNLSNNIILDASSLFCNCHNLQKVILSENIIKQINFLQYDLPKIRVLIVNNNRLENIVGLNQLKNLQKIKIGYNFLTNLQVLNLAYLTQFNLCHNMFDSIEWLEQSQLANIKSLDASSSGISQTLSHQSQSLTFKFLNLCQFLFNDNIVGILNLKSKALQYVSADKCNLKRINLNTQQTTYLSICDNQIQNLDDILSSQMPNMKTLKCKKAGQLPLLPKLNAIRLKVLDLSQCKINNIINLKASNIPEINEIYLSKNEHIKKIPEINFKNLKKFDTAGLKLQNLNFLNNQQNLRNLQELVLDGQTEDRITNHQTDNSLIFPVLKFQKLKCLKIQQFPFYDLQGLSKSTLPELKQLTLSTLKLEKLEPLKFQKLHKLKLQNVSVNNENQFSLEMGQLNQIKIIQVYSSTLKCIQMINQKKKLIQFICSNQQKLQLKEFRVVELQTLVLNRCNIGGISIINKCHIPNIKQLNLSENNIIEVPKLTTMKNLVRVNLSYNRIGSLQQFAKSQIKNLQSLNISFNQIKSIPALRQSLKHFVFDFNPIQNLSDLQKCSLQNILQARFIGLNNLRNTRNLPPFKFLSAKYLIIVNCNLENLQSLVNWQIPQVQSFIIGSGYPITLPKLKPTRLKDFGCFYSKDKNNIMIQLHRFQQLKHENYEKKTKDLAQQAEHFYDNNRGLDNIQALSTWQCINLKSIYLQNMNLKSLPQLHQQLQNFVIRSSYLDSIGEFKSSSFSSIQKVVFYRIKNLRHLQISDRISRGKLYVIQSDVQKVDDFLDSQCSNLILKDNKIKQIGRLDLKQAQSLVLNNNFLTNVNFFSSTTRIKILRLKGNRIAEIPQDVYFQELIQIHLVQNLFKKIKFVNGKFPKLQYIIANKNQISKIEQMSPSSLHQLRAQENIIEDVDFFDQQIQLSLSNLDLKDNKIRSVKYIPPVKKIQMSNNPIESLVWINQQCSNIIQSIVIKNAQIKDFGVFSSLKLKFTQLVKIDLSGNQGTYFPTVQRIYENLNQLNLSNNRFINEIEFPQTNFPMLEKIDLSFNRLTSFRSALKKLKYVIVNNNQITSLQLNQISLQALRELKIHDNYITQIDFISKCPSLITIQAQNNKITDLPNLSNNTSLQVINLDGNPLKNFQGFQRTNQDQLDVHQFQYSVDNSISNRLPQSTIYALSKFQKKAKQQNRKNQLQKMRTK